ncbi:ASCH domain-containing protein [uncultured Lamprocystis sp.]|jgi:hypothetical protein|uniref:ASCH domain-containing protein n=1 Tax=uncultured Lamprocystis sp. TaxID=543132 RepID=UPI0025D24F53|nr:ASCH domain-containing protein [uncultured Lamprocystis sp.]
MNHADAPVRALVIASPHIEHILSGQKTWEMRSKTCKIRGTIGLIRKGSGKVVGLVDITGVRGPLTRDELMENLDKLHGTREQIYDPAFAKWNFAWILAQVRPLKMPVAYVHPKGAVGWVTLDENVRAQISAQMHT